MLPKGTTIFRHTSTCFKFFGGKICFFNLYCWLMQLVYYLLILKVLFVKSELTTSCIFVFDL